MGWSYNFLILHILRKYNIARLNKYQYLKLTYYIKDYDNSLYYFKIEKKVKNHNFYNISSFF